MALLDRSEWFDLARTTQWTPGYVSVEELFPPWLSDIFDLPEDVWEQFDEPFKVSYREYVKVQREKDAAAYSVKSALQRSDLYDKTDPGWKSVLKFHYGGICVPEFNSASRFARLVRFGKSPAMRNVAAFGTIDEIRHAQIQLSFAHELVSRDPDFGQQFKWAHKGYGTNNPVVISVRRMFDDIDNTRDAASTAVMATTVLETGFTNLQFIALSADAARSGDHLFSNLIQSIQSDEARHAQIGQEVLRLMVENGRVAEAQRLIDVSFWVAWRQFAVLTGISMDYYTPLDQREMSFKEFMHEWVGTQFERQIRDLGLKKPWYWEIFLRDIEELHHGQHMTLWLGRHFYWWNPAAGVTPDEREWLESKYPGWNDTFGKVWDVVIDNLLKGDIEKTVLNTPPIACHISHLRITGVPGNRWKVTDFHFDYEGRRYHFGSEVDRWIFEQDPERYKGRYNLTERFLNGTIQPPTFEGLMQYIGIAEEGGTDAHNYEWIDKYRHRPVTDVV